MAWLQGQFPTYFQVNGQPVPLAPHHEEFWRWLWQLMPGVVMPAFIQVLARGGGKSTETEMGCASLGYFGLRRYGLYLSGTQDQADDHVENVATLFASLGVDRALSQYGYSKGWRANRLRTQDGFNLDAIGLDTASRGRKLDNLRPDFIVLDDIDEEHDTERTIQRKIKTLTRKILPMGTASTAVLGVQNVPNPDGVFAQLVDGRADFLLDRLVSGPHPAIRDMTYELVAHAHGLARVKITGGVATWAGQSLENCEVLINTKIGLAAFLVECQHETDRLRGQVFQKHWFPIVEDYPHDADLVRFWDMAATDEGTGTDPAWTAGVLIAHKGGQFWIVDVQRWRLSPGKSDVQARQVALHDGQAVKQRWEEEGGSSGKKASEDYARNVFRGCDAKGIRSTGDKVTRARPLASAAENGNVFVIRGVWNMAFLDEAETFPQGKKDQIDAASGAHGELSGTRRRDFGAAPIGLRS